MSKTSRWLAVLVVLAVLVALVLLWRGCRHGEPRPPAMTGQFAVDEITLTSPDLDLGLVAVRTTAHQGYTEWACVIECGERGGCSADIRVRVLYRVAGDKRTLTLGGRLEAARGETTRIGRVQRPPVEVEQVDEVIVEVAASHNPDAPRPTLVQ